MVSAEQIEAARQCGYEDELSGAPSEAAPKRFLTAELFPHYSDGRQIGLNYLIDQREAADVAAHEADVAAEMRDALRECADKLWVLRCNSRDPLDREAAERACDLADGVLRKARGQ